MEKNVIDALRSLLLDQAGFRELEHCIGIAGQTRSIMREFDLNDQYMAKELDLQPEEFFHFLCGSYPYDIRIISKLEVISQKLAAEKASSTRQKLINVPPYKYSENNPK